MSHRRFDWENLNVIARNKEEGHALAHAYECEHDAVARTKPPYQLSLNGTWKFHWSMGVKLPPHHDAANLNDTAWDDIQVPGVWQLSGYGSPYYYATSYPQAIGTSKRRIPYISHALQEKGIYRDVYL